MESSECKRKCTALFDKLLRDKFELNPEQSETLLKYLDGSQHKGVAKILKTPFFANLLVNALQNSREASISVKIFLSKLVCSVLSNEVLFNRFVQMQGFELLVVGGYAELAVPDASPELLLAMTQQAMALVAHYSGIKHVVDSNLFQKIMTPHTHHKPPSEVADITYLFMAKLTWKLNEYEEEAALLKVLNYIITPLITSPLTSATADPDNLLSCSESLLPFVHTLVCILGEVEHLMVPNNVVLILSNVFMIECKLTQAMERSPDPVLVRLLAEATVRFYYAASQQVALLRPDTETRDNQKFYEAVNKILCMLIKTCSYPTVLEFLCHCHAFSYKVETIKSSVVVEKLMENYFILLILIPLFMRQLLFKKIVNDPKIEDTNEIFLSDVAQSVPPDSIRLAYDLRKLIYESMDLTSACYHSIKELLQLKRLLNRQQAGLVFQTLFYTLNQFVLSDGSDLVLLANPLQTPEEELLLTKNLDAIAMLLDEHVINWHESLEVVQLQAALVNLVKQNILPVKLLVQAVELMTMSVRNLLSPELTLLMESHRGGSLREVAGAAGVLLGRPEGDARHAALQLIFSFLEIAYVKFMPLRAVISAHRLVVGAARCALSDKDVRTQAAALRCLAAAARCEDLWTELLELCDTLYEQLVNTMRCNSDGEVRKEATTVLAEVYTHRKVTEAFTTYVSKAMATVATEDPHWPVRTAALRFWKQYMKYQFTDRGMIDGTFPSVTFCKEKRKIVALKDKEIHKQLDIAMSHLSASGCLGVLLKCLDPSNHKKVIEITFSMTDKLIELLDCYKYSGVSNVAQNSETLASCASASPRRVDIKRAQSLIEDGDLIAEIFGSLGSEILKSERVGPIEVVQPKDFIEALREARETRPAKGDLSSLISEILASV